MADSCTDAAARVAWARGAVVCEGYNETMVDSGLLIERKAGKCTCYGVNRRNWDEFMLVLDTISNETYWKDVDLSGKKGRRKIVFT